jgi:phage FluMu protein Com
MITVTIKNQGAIEFEDFENAMAFVEEHPEMYAFDVENLSLFSDEPFEGLIIAEEAIKEVFQCAGCKVCVGFHRRSDQKELRVKCPNCEAIHNIKVKDDARASKS